MSSTTNSEPPHAVYLPNEILANIFSYLDKPSKQACRLVCAKWKYVTDFIFFTFHATLSDVTYSQVIEATVDINTLRVLDFVQQLPQQCGTSSRSGLAICPNRIVFQGSIRSEEKGEDHDGPSVSMENIVKILRCNRDIMCLTFEKCSLSGVRGLQVDGLCLRKLKCMEIDMSGKHGKRDDNVLGDIGKIKKPELRTIELRSQKDGGYEHYVKLFRFVAAHASTLDMLNLQVNLLPCDHDDDHSPEDRQQNVRELKMELSKVNISQLKIKLSSQEGHAPYNIGTRFLSRQKQLVFLEVTIPTDGNSKRVFRAIRGCVERSTDTLISFTIRRYALAESSEEIAPILQALSKCSCLTILELYMYSIADLETQLPATVRNLALVGNLGPDLLQRACEYFPALENLKFANFGGTENQTIDQGASVDNLTCLLKMPRIRNIKFYSEGFNINELQLKMTEAVSVGRCSRNVNVFSFSVQ